MTQTRLLLAAAGAAVLLAGAGQERAVAAPAETRTIALHNIHTDETLTVEYKLNGRYVPEAMKQINWIMRDWRKDESTRIDPALIDLIWEVHNELGSKEPINVISGFRSRATNDMLRKTVGGQASESRHITGEAADVQFPDIPLKQLRYSALIRERGGVGYYPTSATPFVHLDTDRVRAWPRLPRHELALLFRNGSTRHVPPDGNPITPDDVKTARQSHAELAEELADFHALRQQARTRTLLAASGARPQPAPRSSTGQTVAMLSPAPKEAPRPTPPPKLLSDPAERPTEGDRRQLSQLASLAALPQLVSGPTLATRPRPVASSTIPKLAGPDPEPALQLASLGGDGSKFEGRFGWGAAWLQAPAYDEEHPDEDSYRPFPITPFLTDSSSPDHPSFLGADPTGSAPPLPSAPLQHVAELLWVQQFNGEAVALSAALKVAVGTGR